MDSSNTVIVSVMVEEKGRQTADKKKGRKPWTLRKFRGQTVWDWLHLLSALAIPVVLAAAGLWFTAQQDQRQVAIENQRAEAERELAEQRAQDEALQAYLDQMGQLLLERHLRDSDKDSEVRILARARTLTVLGRLDPSRRTQVLRFLTEADLVRGVDDRAPIIGLSNSNLSGADLVRVNLSHADLNSANLSNAVLLLAKLSNADLHGADLHGADLLGADLTNANLSYAKSEHADLSHADLSGADAGDASLEHADLINADLSNANLTDAFLFEAKLSGAHLSDATLRFAHLFRTDLTNANLINADLTKADLTQASLNRADLSGANLSGAYLGGADLSNANLAKSKITKDQLAKCKSLEGATMPNGQKYEDWLKDKGRGEG